MRGFKFSFFILNFLFLSLITGCSSSENGSSNTSQSTQRICPQCNMPVPESNIYSCNLENNGKISYFDDIGCLILWTKNQKIDINAAKAEVFTNDTHKYINIKDAYYTINEKTPMNYGFAAYEHKKEDTFYIKIDEVKLKMLRGEHLANPKIRKQILGY
ncbi:hypothetical protein [Sulfurimonas sp. CVO]|uniref:hypothetical protein n=1 Tax=Sulfurimonas sp. CVO TaxID=2283483 RepID=UPI00165EFFCB|nr:hypothetical protein [Sulfurimonas sp. CVO]